MKFVPVASRALAAVFAFSCIAPAGARAREPEKLPARILNPMPAFDPFDRPHPPPQFFPDEVDRRARATLVDGLTANHEALDDHLDFFQQKDRDLRDAQGTATGLTAKVRELRDGQSSERRNELAQADELLRKGSANRFGAIFNRLLSSVDLVSIVSGSYIGAAVDAAMGQLFTAGEPNMPFEERKALVLLQNHLKRDPDHPRAEGIRSQIKTLAEKKHGALVRERLQRAEDAKKKGDLRRAEFYYELALLIDPDSGPAQKGLAQARERRQEQARATQQALTVVERESEGAAEATGVGELLYALTLREVEGIEAQARLVEARYAGQPLGESAKDALAVAAEIGGRHDEAKQILQAIAGSSSAPREQRRAAFLLESPEYDLRASLEQARRQHRLETVKYVLLGEDLLGKNLLYGTAPLVVGGPAGATTLAAANVLMIGSNLFEVLTANPISPQPVIDKAAAYIRRHPNGENATEVYTLLAKAYEEAGKYDRALLYYGLSGTASPRKLADVEEAAARTLLRAEEKSGERAARAAYLRAVLERYPESEAAKTATQRLVQLAKAENQGFRLSKQFLLHNPDLYGSHGLRLKPTLFDGDLRNMELADWGINLLSDRELVLHFQTPWGRQSQSYAITTEDSDRFAIALRQKRYENPELLKELPLALFRDAPPKRPAGAEPEETTLRFVRETPDAPERPLKVLEHELVSASEKRHGGAFPLPRIQGNIGASGFDLSGSLPSGLWADRLALGADQASPFAGIQLPIPLLRGFIPVDFMLQARPGRLSVFPKIHQFNENSEDRELYR